MECLIAPAHARRMMHTQQNSMSVCPWLCPQLVGKDVWEQLLSEGDGPVEGSLQDEHLNFIGGYKRPRAATSLSSTGEFGQPCAQRGLACAPGLERHVRCSWTSLAAQTQPARAHASQSCVCGRIH